jgi:SSS family transporter
MNHTLRLPDLIIISVFLAVTLYLGLRFARRRQSTQSYFLAKGKIPAWAIGMSLLSSLISSVTFLAYPGEGYSSNWILLVQGLMVPVVLVGMIWFVVPLYRKVIGLSTYEYFEKRFGSFARYYSSLAFVLRQFSAMGTIFFLLALALSNMIGCNTTLMITAIGCIIITINLLGGIEAVIWLDVFQGFLLFASGIVCLSVLLFSAADSPAQVWQIARNAGHTGFGPYDLNFTHLTFIVMAINGVFYAIQKYGTDQTVVQRYLTAKTDKAAIRASLMGVLLTVPIWMLFMFIGTGLFVYYKVHPAPVNLRADAIFPYFIMTRLPTGLVGFIISAMTSAAICSMSADLNSLAAVGVEDYYKKWRPGLADRKYLRAGRWMVVGGGILSILIAMLYVSAGSDGVLGIVFTLYAIFSGGISGIFLLGMFSARTNRQGMNIGIIACILFTSYAFLTSTQIGVGAHKSLLLDMGVWNFTQHKLMLGVYSHLVVIVVGYVASLFFPKPVLDQNLLYSGWKAARRLERRAAAIGTVTLLLIIGTFSGLHAQTLGSSKGEIPTRRIRLSYEEGKDTLDRLASLYHNKNEWERRKNDLRPCLYQALKLSPLPPAPATAPITTPWRKMDGYEISNIAIEILPGLYVNGSLYRPLHIKGKIPVILNPDGHWERQRYRADCQIRCAALARMGAMAFSYDMFAWGESLLQFRKEDHRTGLAMSLQLLGGIRILDYLLSLKEADKERVAITGGSGGGTQTVYLTALDDRIKVSVPVVSVSAYFYGGCPCESGMPIHDCAGGTDNVELAAMAAPRPQLLISDGHDWTDHMPEHDFPYLQHVYGYYGAAGNVENVHLKDDNHDYGLSKRVPMYKFMARHLGLDLGAVLDKKGVIDETRCTVEPDTALYVFGGHGERLPADAIMGFDNLQRVFAGQAAGPRYRVAVADLMILKRQKLGAFPLASAIGADGVEVDMGGLGARETFDNALAVDSIRQQFLEKAKALNLGISSLAMTGFYSQSFATRPTWQRMVSDCIRTMNEMGVRVGFLPLGVNSDLVKDPGLRPAIVHRLKWVGKLAESAGVVIGIETTLPAADELQLLKDIGSPAIQVYFNFANALDAKRDLCQELRILGKEHICQIHCTNTDGVWLQNDPAIDLKKVRETLDQMGWSGWLVIERSRDAKDVHNVLSNFGANTRYVKSIFQTPAGGAAIYIAPDGSDGSPGTRDAPLATIAAALRKVREWRRLSDPMVANGVHIILKGGEYPLSEPLFLRPEDSGTPASPTIIEAAPGEAPVLSGGRTVRGWKKLTGVVGGLPAAARGKVWVTDAPVEGGQRLSFRQLWIDGVKAIRARSVNDEDQMMRILSVDKQRKEMWIPVPRNVKLPDQPGQMEMTIHQMWATAVLRIKSIDRVGDRLTLRFREPEGSIEFEHPWPAAVIDPLHRQNGSSAFFLANAIEFLDEPGEWYEDLPAGKLYYWPRAGEEMTTASVVAPVLTRLVEMTGTIDRPISHLQWKGIQFSWSTWMRPSESGHVPLQAGMFLLDAYKLKIPGTPDKKGLENQAWIGRPPGAVELTYANHILFQGCRFTHLASTGLDFTRGTQDDSTVDCVFKDIGGTGIQVGVYSDPAFETHLPYDPADPREICSRETILNNLVTDCTNEDWGCVGIGAGYVRDIRIEHNEVSEVSYSGICVGWGWTKTINCMRNNHITGNYVHHYAKHMYDVGGIYTLSAQPGTVISQNRIDSIYHPVYAHDPNHWFWFYFDEGSSYITIRDNWCPGEKFMRNSNGPGNTWENNGPMVADKIKNAAGIKK